MKKKIIAIVATLMMVLMLMPVGISYAKTTNQDKFDSLCQEYIDTILDDEGNLIIDSYQITKEDELLIISEKLAEKRPDNALEIEVQLSNNNPNEYKLIFAMWFDDEENPYGAGEYLTKSVYVPVIYNYNSNVKALADKYISALPADQDTFEVRDMEIINYWLYSSMIDRTQIDENVLSNYCSEFRNYFANSNFDIYVDGRMGAEEDFFTSTAGCMQLIFDDVCYFIQEYLNIEANHILYVPTNTPNDPTDLAKAAQKRIDEYIGKDLVTIEANTEDPTVSEYLENSKADLEEELKNKKAELKRIKDEYDSTEKELNELIESNSDASKRDELSIKLSNLQFEIWDLEFDIENLSNGVKYFKENNEFLYEFLEGNDSVYLFKATVNNQTYNLIILPDSSKMVTPTFGTKDLLTDVEIKSDSSEVPLDSMIEAEKKDEFEDILKEEKGVTDENSLTYDLKVHSKTLAHAKSNSANGYITELDNGEFEVVVPIKDTSLEGKKIVAYYVYTDGPGNSGNELIEEHEVTVKDGYAVFTTNHFSTYTLAAVDDKGAAGGTDNDPSKPNSVPTGDNSMPFLLMGIMLIAAAGIFGVRRRI